jgi:hypothetical protein
MESATVMLSTVCPHARVDRPRLLDIGRTCVTSETGYVVSLVARVFFIAASRENRALFN